MNPIALILIGAGIVAIKTMSDNFTGNKLAVKVDRIINYKLSTEGLQFIFSVTVNNPFPHDLVFKQAIVGVEYNKDKFLRTVNQGNVISKEESQHSFTALIPYHKILLLLPALIGSKLTNASITLTIELQAGGYKGSDYKVFKLDSQAQDTTKTT